MKNRNDLKEAFGKADEGFRENVLQILDGLEDNRREKPMKKIGLRVAVAIMALMVVGVSVVAMRKQWGILDYIGSRGGDKKTLPEAVYDVQKDVEQEVKKGVSADGKELATFQVREAIYDGSYVYIAVECKPMDGESLLIGTDVVPEDPVRILGEPFKEIKKDVTITDYVKENGRSLYHTSIEGNDGNNGNLIMDSMDFIYEEGGKLVYMLKGRYEGDVGEVNMDLICRIAPYKEEQGKYELDLSGQVKTTVTCKLEASNNNGSVSSKEPVEFTDCGVRVDRVTLTGSSMAIYTEVEYTVLDREKYEAMEDGLWFEFLDEDGEVIPGGAASGGETGPEDEEGRRFIQKTSLTAGKDLPDTVTLRAYNCWDKTRYETKEIHMEP